MSEIIELLPISDLIDDIAVDLDGVKADFAHRVFEIAGWNPDHADVNVKGTPKDFWKLINIHLRTPGATFFESMRKMPDADVLMAYVDRYPNFVLSATGNHFATASLEKRNWVRKHYGHEKANAAIFVRDAADKAQYANPRRVLIDDRMKAIAPWREAGGIGIFHKNAESTIAQMKELGL